MALRDFLNPKSDFHNFPMLGSKSFISEVKVELQKASWPWEPKEKGMKKYK